MTSPSYRPWFLELVPATPEHVSELGRIAYEEFKDISDRHHFPPDVSSAAIWRPFIATRRIRRPLVT